jgi:glyoxylase-like metal-dependent hydrolase (beta-lactamase superfamily II)
MGSHLNRRSGSCVPKGGRPMNDRISFSCPMQRLLLMTLAIAIAALAAGVPAPANAQTANQPAAAVTLVAQAAEALGGAQQLRDIRNITLAGYGQWAWVDGAEEISSSPHVPIKYEAVNDLRRVYDLENNRFQARERGFMLFPFLAANSYNFTLTDKRLDGDIAYDPVPTNMFGPAPSGPQRLQAIGSGIFPEGAHMRRMWMMNDPIVLVRAMMDPSTALSAPRVEGNYTVVDITLKQGDHLSAGFFSPTTYCQSLCEYLPAFVRWSTPNPDLGEAIFTTWLTGYASINGLMLPLGYDTRLDWRDIDYFRLYVDHYDTNSQIPDLAAPAEVRDAPVPPEYALRPIKAEKVADHIWRLSPNGTTVIEFSDHLTLFELDADPPQAKAIVEFARTLVPGKPVTQLICSHEHFDHVAGLREAVSEGLSVISRRPNAEQFEEMVNHPDPDFPDDLARSPKPLNFVPVDEKLVLSDPTMTLWVLWARNDTHMADAVVAYAPAQKVIMEGDVATAAYIWQFWPDNFHDIIDYYHLDVVLDSPVHAVVPGHPGALTLQQVDDLLKEGTERARKLCADQMAKGFYLAGCPVWSKRY